MLNPSERRMIPNMILGGSSLTLVMLVFDAAAKQAAGESLQVVDYGVAIMVCALLAGAIRFKRLERKQG